MTSASRPRKSAERLILAAVLALPGLATAGEEFPLLEVGPPIERTISRGEAHRYRLRVEAGTFARAVVDQRGVDLAVTVRDAQEQELFTQDTPVGLSGPEPVSVLAGETAQEILLDVYAAAQDHTEGSYTIALLERRPAQPADRHRVDGERAVGRAQRLRVSGRGEDMRAALAAMDEALACFRALRDRWWEALAHAGRGSLLQTQGQLREAVEAHRAAVALRADLGEPRYEAASRNSLGSLLISLSQWAEAGTQLDRALALWRSAGDRSGESSTLHNLGSLASQQGDLETARRRFEETLALRRQLGDRYTTASTLNNLAATYRLLGEHQTALAAYREALELRRAFDDRTGTRGILNNLGVLSAQIGERERAEGYLRESLALSRESGDRLALANALQGLSGVLLQTGKEDEAGRLLQEALGLCRESGNRRGEAIAVTGLGDLARRQGRAAEAVTLLGQAVDLHRAVGYRVGEVEALFDLALARAAAGEAEPARAALAEALALARAVRLPVIEAKALTETARLAAAEGRLPDALAAIEEAVALLEDLRNDLTAPDLRASFRAVHEPAYALRVEILLRLHAREPGAGWDAAALEAAEKSRARSLFERLAAGGVELRHGVDPALLDRETALRREIRALERRRATLADPAGKAPAASPEAPDEIRAGIEAEVRRKLEDYRAVEAEILAASPAYAALARPEPLTVAAMRELLDPRTAVVEITLGEERSHAWVLTRDSLKVRELPGRAALEESARLLLERVTAQERRAAQRQAEIAAAELSAQILGPLADLLASFPGERLVVVADGALHAVPFGVLPWTPAASSPEPLLARFEIVSLPSLSVLQALRRTARGEQPGHPSHLEVAVLADPVFSADDPRLAGRAGGSVTTAAARAVPEAVRAGLERLTFSGREAAAILALIPKEDGLAALGFRADRATATGPAVGGARIVHFATHALLDGRNPELSGIVLSLRDEKGQEQDGFLRLQDLYALDLSADLVVLSACRTALGREVPGEGLIGLTRGFFHAGAPRVVATLWDVQDGATAELMARFYRGLLQEKLPAAAALRRAQLSLRAEKRWESPYFWAGFVLQGDWR
jgi:CHAT domain-containing protein/tetratricopeptide (TPR) repeat protein